MRYALFVILILSTATISFSENLRMKILHQWKYVNYFWNDPEKMEYEILSGNFRVRACVLYDVDQANDGRVFVTAPKEINFAIPATLMTVSDIQGQGGPLLVPYPNWQWHNNYYGCNRIVNVFRIHIKCNHLFVLDSGKIKTKQACDPKLLIFDLKSNRLIKTIQIPINIATNKSGSGLLVTPLVYVPGKCSGFLDKMIIFMADMQGYGLVMYDSSTKRMCRIESDFMEPTDTHFKIVNQHITYVGGIFGLATFYDELFYTPISGKSLYKVKINELKKCPNRTENYKQTKLVAELSSQTGAIASTKCAILFSDFKNVSLLGIDVCKEFDPKSVVLTQDLEKLQAIYGLKILTYQNKLIGLSNKYQRFMTDTYYLSETNFYIFELNLTEIHNKLDSINSFQEFRNRQ